MLLVTLGGLFIVSALIGVIATALDEKLLHLRKGRSFVNESDHTIVLGWGESVFTIVSELAVANESEKNASIVSEMLDDRNHELAQVTQVDDVIVSDKVLSLLLAQISENEHLAAVFAELFEADGSEIYLRPVEEYVAVGQETTFATVVAAARERGETAIGLRRHELSQEPSAAHGVQLNRPSRRRRGGRGRPDRGARRGLIAVVPGEEGRTWTATVGAVRDPTLALAAEEAQDG